MKPKAKAINQKENKELYISSISTNNDLKLIFDQYYNGLCSYATRFVKRTDIAEEIIQDVFIQIWEKKDSIDYFTSLKSYLYSAAKNKCINYLKQQIRQDSLLISYSENEFPAEEDNVNTDFSAIIKKAIESLPTKCQTIFNLNKFGGLTYQEISEDLDISKKTVENQMGIALKKLRQFIKDNDIYQNLFQYNYSE